MRGSGGGGWDGIATAAETETAAPIGRGGEDEKFCAGASKAGSMVASSSFLSSEGICGFVFCVWSV